MSSSKRQLYANALDLAQQQGRWNDTLAAPNTAHGLTWPELLRKFNKHNPSDSLTSLTAEVELKIHQLLKQAASDNGFNSDASYERDCPFRSFPHFFPDDVEGQDISGNLQHPHDAPIFPPIIHSDPARAELRQLLSRLRDVQSAQSSASNTTLLSASIVLGFGEYALGDYEAAVPLLSPSNDVQELPSSHLADLLLAARTLQGLISEHLHRLSEAFATYSAVLGLMSRYVHTSPQTLYWAEKASYRRALLSRTLDSENAAKAHHEYVSQNHLPLKYATVLRSHLYLIEDHTADTSLRDIVKVEEQYELLLRRVTSFPRAGDVNTRMLDFVDRVFKIWLSANSEAALKQHARHEVDEPDTLRVIGIMERALSYTFQSHRLLRYLLTLHMALNNKSQALKAFELYEKLWEKAKETDLVNVSRKLRQFRLEDEANDSADVPKQAPSANGHLATAAAPVQPDDEEADIDRPLTYIGACCLAAKVYCSDPRREDEARKATSFMERALELIPEGTSNEIRASVQKWLGIAKACQAFDEYNPETRPVLLKSALALLTSSVTDNPASFEAHYHLALLQAEQGQNTSAIATIQKGLQINPGSSEAWNLLVLLISAETSRKAEALQLATAALSGHLSQDEPDVPDSAFTTNTYSLPRANLSDAVTFTSLRAIIQLRITRIVLIEATEGPQAALVFFKELYSSFAKDFAPFLQSAPSASSEAAPLGHAAPPNGAPPNQHSHLQVAASSLLPTRRLSLRSKRARKVRPHSTAADTSRPGSVAASASPGSSRPASVADGDLGSGAAPESATMSSQSNNWTGSTTQLGQCRHRQAQAMEQMLWLLTAATFRRAGDLEQAREAIFEAEKIDPTRPDVWVQLGLLQAQQEDIDAAIESMDKALTFSLDYVPALVHLSRLLILKRAENSSLLDLAAGYMKECSEQRGHSTADVWLTLGQIYELQERWAESRAALLKALELQERQPIRPLEIALPRIL